MHAETVKKHWVRGTRMGSRMCVETSSEVKSEEHPDLELLPLKLRVLTVYILFMCWCCNLENL